LRQSFYEILSDLRKEGATILLSSHALAELEGEVDRVVVMNRGKKVADGGIAELRKLAAIKPRIRCRVDDPGFGHQWSPLPDGRLERSCAEDEVGALLRSLPASAQQIEILRPTLDELYAQFQKGAA